MLRSRPRRVPLHRCRAAKLRRQRLGRLMAVFAAVVAVVLASSVLGGGGPSPSRAVRVAAVTTAPPAPLGGPALSTLAAFTVSAPPVTLDFERQVAVAAAAPVGMPLPPQYLHGGSVDQGVDYLAPGGTPLYAMGPGIIAQEGGPGTSGFGPNIPVLQITGGPLAGKTVYYGHAGPDTVAVGTVVAAGQQISVVGHGIVGISTAPHLEIGFWPLGGRHNGQAMMDYLDQLMGQKTGR